MRFDIANRTWLVSVWVACTGLVGCGSDSSSSDDTAASSGGDTSGGGQGQSTAGTSNATTQSPTSSAASNSSGGTGGGSSGPSTSTSSGGGGTGGTSTSAGGATTGTPNSTGSAGSGGTSGEAHPTFVYVGSGSFEDEPGMVTVYSLDRTSKTLTSVADYPAGSLASFLAIDGERGRLFAGDERGGGVISFSIDKATGKLTNLGATASSNQPVYLSVTEDGQYLLAANYNQGSVDVYPIGSDGRAMDSLGATETGDQAHCVVIDSKNRVFVANKGSGTIALFGFAGGTLSPTAMPTTFFSSARHLFVSGEKLYAISENMDLLAGFNITAEGDLSLDWERQRLQNGNGTGADIQVTPSGKYLYATNRDPDNTIVAYDISGSEPVLLEHESTLGDTPRNFAIDPAEEFVIVANHGDNKSLVIFTIQADGSLEPEAPLSTGFSPYFVGMMQF